MFNRLMMTIRSNINEMISKAEDPEKMLNHVIIEMQSQLVTAKRQVAIVIADEKRLRKQSEAAHSESTRWEQKAMLAIKAGDDNLARAALGRKHQHDELVGVYQQQWEAQKKNAEALRFALHGLAGKIDEAKRTRRVLVARLRRAEAQRHIANTLSNINATSPLGVIERMEERIVQAEAAAEAAGELDGSLEPTLEAQFRALEANSDVELQLAALKEKMALKEAESRPRALRAASN